MAPQQRTGPDDIMAWVEEEMVESLRAKQAFIKECAGTLSAICAALADRLERGGKLLLFGNGGSAADAQHIAAEFVGCAAGDGADGEQFNIDSRGERLRLRGSLRTSNQCVWYGKGCGGRDFHER